MMIKVPAALLAAFPPSADLLLDRARRQTDDAMLTEIARADYGLMADKLMAELRFIRDDGVIPAPLPWMLGEVLTLTHYSNPLAPGPMGRRAHQTRLFACAVLLGAEAGLPHGGVDIAMDSAMAQCLVSANLLGEEMSEGAACYLTWRIARLESSQESLLFALGLLILATRLRRGRLGESSLGETAGWVLSIESFERRRFPASPADPRPLPLSLQVGFWQPLVAEFRDEVKSIRDDAVRGNLELCGLLLDPGW